MQLARCRTIWQPCVRAPGSSEAGPRARRGYFTIVDETEQPTQAACCRTGSQYGFSCCVSSCSAYCLCNCPCCCSGPVLESTVLWGQERQPISGSSYDTKRFSRVCVRQFYGHPRRTGHWTMLRRVFEKRQLSLLQLPNSDEWIRCLPTVPLPSAKSRRWRRLCSLCGKSIL